MAFGFWHVKIVNEDGYYRVVWYPREDEEIVLALNKTYVSEVEAEVYAEKLRAVIHRGEVDPSDHPAVIASLKQELRAGLQMKNIGNPAFRVSRR